MPFDCSSHLRVYWADRPLAQTGARYLACLLCCLAPAYSQTASSSPQWTESVWFGGVVAVVAVLQLQRFMRTGRKLCLLYVATIGVGAWVIEASALPLDTHASDGQMTLPVAHMLFAAAVVAGAWWTANRERTQAALAAGPHCKPARSLRKTPGQPHRPGIQSLAAHPRAAPGGATNRDAQRPGRPYGRCPSAPL
jgi:hypothetical protein